jgi:hypothetical protein
MFVTLPKPTRAKKASGPSSAAAVQDPAGQVAPSDEARKTTKALVDAQAQFKDKHQDANKVIMGRSDPLNPALQLLRAEYKKNAKNYKDALEDDKARGERIEVLKKLATIGNTTPAAAAAAADDMVDEDDSGSGAEGDDEDETGEGDDADDEEDDDASSTTTALPPAAKAGAGKQRGRSKSPRSKSPAARSKSPATRSSTKAAAHQEVAASFPMDD